MMDYIKKMIKSRTVWLGAIVSLLGWIQTVIPELPIDPLYQGYAGMFVGLLIVLLRLDTKDAIEDK